jgi:hypothetical protein
MKSLLCNPDACHLWSQMEDAVLCHLALPPRQIVLNSHIQYIFGFIV